MIVCLFVVCLIACLSVWLWYVVCLLIFVYLCVFVGYGCGGCFCSFECLSFGVRLLVCVGVCACLLACVIGCLLVCCVSCLCLFVCLFVCVLVVVCWVVCLLGW